MPDKADNSDDIDLLYCANLAYGNARLMVIDPDSLDMYYPDGCFPDTTLPITRRQYQKQMDIGIRHQKELEVRCDRNPH